MEDKVKYGMAALAGLGAVGASVWMMRSNGKEEEPVTLAESTETPIVNSSMDIFIKYLKEAKKEAKEGSEPLCVCLGNTSGDVDSIVGALGMAYYLTLKEKRMWVPLINCNKDELKLKPEIWEHLINKCKIPFDDLIFYDELLSYGKKHAHYALIDHNVLDEKQATAFGDGAHKKVVHVYDHHPDTQKYDFT